MTQAAASVESRVCDNVCSKISNRNKGKTKFVKHFNLESIWVSSLDIMHTYFKNTLSMFRRQVIPCGFSDSVVYLYMFGHVHAVLS